MLFHYLRPSSPSSSTSRATRRALALAALASVVSAQSPMTPGNLIVVRVGDGGTPLTAAAAPVFLHEYSPSGTLIQVIALPTASTGNQHAFTQAGTATLKGSMSRTADGRYFLVTGYAAAPGTPNVAQTTSAAVRRVVARIGVDGTIDTSTALGDAYSGGALTSAASVDGSEFWLAGSNSVTAAGSGGVRHAQLGATVSTQVCSTVSDPRKVAIAGESLLASSASPTSPGLYRIGSQLSSAPGQPASLTIAGAGTVFGVGGGGSGPGGGPGDDPVPSICNQVPSGCDSYIWFNEMNNTIGSYVECPPNPPVLCGIRYFWGTGGSGGGDPWWNPDNEYWPIAHHIDRGDGSSPPNPWVSMSGVEFRAIHTILPMAAWSVVGAGCPGSAGIPMVTLDASPLLGRFSNFQLTNLPFGLGIVAIGAPLPFGIDLGMLGAPGCAMHTTLDMTALVLGSGTAATFSLGIPNDTALLGADFASQSASLDPMANAFGWTVSNAIRATIGR